MIDMKNNETEKNRHIRIALFSGGMDNDYNSVYADSIVHIADQNNCSIIWFQSLCNTYADTRNEAGEENIYNLFNPALFDAAVLLTLSIKKKKCVDTIVEKARRGNLPIFSIDVEIEGAYNIVLGYTEGIARLIRHLIEKHNVTSFGFLGGMKGNYASDERETVYRNVLKEHNIPVDERFVMYGSFWGEPACNAVLEAYEKYGELPRAMVCANDAMAVGVSEAAYKLGLRIPDDLIVTGLDGIEEALAMTPSITTAKRDVAKAAEKTIELVKQYFFGEKKPEKYTDVNAECLYMQSCGCRAEIDFYRDNLVKHRIYSELGSQNGFSEGLSYLAVEVNGGFDFRETALRIGKYMRKLWTKRSWLCICDDYITNVNELDDIYASYDSYTVRGYSKVMSTNVTCAVYGDRYEVEELEPFDSSMLLPNLEGVFEKFNNLMFFSLHYQDRIIGYIALEFSQCRGNFYLMNTFMRNVSMVLENARIQSELHSFANKLEEMYIRDPMTNLMNRRGFYQCVPKLYDKCVAEKLYFMVISVDLDDLKAINDDYGHSEGDNAIITTANSLLDAANDEIIARFGGDEYVVAGICKHENYGDEFVNMVNRYLENYNAGSGKPYKIHASCGVYKMVPYETLSIDEFISNADEMMYNEKILSKRHRSVARTRQ